MVLSAKYGRTQWHASAPGVHTCGYVQLAHHTHHRHTAMPKNAPATRARCQTAGGAAIGLIKFLTNAIKDTVSVLYWYEELSSFTTGNFWKSSSELFLCLCQFPPPARAPSRGKKGGSTALRVPKSSLTSVLTKPVAA